MYTSITAMLAAATLALSTSANAAPINFSATGTFVGAPASWDLNGLQYAFDFVVEDQPLFPPQDGGSPSFGSYGVQAFTLTFERDGQQHRYEAQTHTNPGSATFGYVGTVRVERLKLSNGQMRDSLRYNASSFASTGADLYADSAIYNPIAVGGVINFDTLGFFSSLALPALNFQEYVGPADTYEASMHFRRGATSVQVGVRGDFTSLVNDVTPVPEPGVMALALAGLLMVPVYRRLAGAKGDVARTW